jgi:hypothetical protein
MSGKSRTIARRSNPESAIHKVVCQHLRARGVRGLLWWHTPNGGARDVITATNMKRLGTLAGVSDLLLLHEGRLFALELKAPRGRATEAQVAFQQAVLAAGGCAAIAAGIDGAVDVLKSWGLLR